MKIESIISNNEANFQFKFIINLYNEIVMIFRKKFSR